MRPSWLFLRLAVQQLGHRPSRAFLLALAVMLGGAALFLAVALHLAVRHSLDTSLNRMGADLMLVPRQTIVHLTPALLTVEPTPHTLPTSLLTEIEQFPGVEAVSPQRYLAIPVSARSHEPLDLVAFDPARDFTVLPWIVEGPPGDPGRGGVLVGGRRSEQVGETLVLFGRSFPVRGRLALTGVGPFERAVFVTFETLDDLRQAAASSSSPVSLPDDAGYSALLVRLRVGATPEQFRFAAARLSDAQVIAGNSLTTAVRQGLQTLLHGAVIFAGLGLVAVTLMVAALYTGLLAERRRELGLLVAVGMRPGQLLRIILAEAALTTAAGAVGGVLLGAALLIAFRRSIGHQFEIHQVPFSLPGPLTLVLVGLGSVALCALVGALGALIPAWRLGAQEPYDLVRGD
ncbi:MAG: ABC transporter permease [Gemmataceae bacterium]